MSDRGQHDHLVSKAKNLRLDTFNAFIEHGEAHLGGSFSLIEMLIALYEVVLTGDDKFILSKAHASFPLCLLLKEKGYDPKLTTHLEIDIENGINCTTGSLGHGLPIGTGMAMARKRLNNPGKIYVIISDGECQEGTTWESLLIAAKHKLDNLVVLIDYNKIQSFGRTNDVINQEPLSERWKSFGWDVVEVDGHDFKQLLAAFLLQHNKPKVIIAHTIKGKGVSFMEDKVEWHYKSPSLDEFEKAIKEVKDA